MNHRLRLADEGPGEGPIFWLLLHPSFNGVSGFGWEAISGLDVVFRTTFTVFVGLGRFLNNFLKFESGNKTCNQR